jgi:hypothetical protein
MFSRGGPTTVSHLVIAQVGWRTMLRYGGGVVFTLQMRILEDHLGVTIVCKLLVRPQWGSFKSFKRGAADCVTFVC